MAKKVLYCLLVVIGIFAVVLYTFWSLWSYGYPNGGSNKFADCVADDSSEENVWITTPEMTTA